VIGGMATAAIPAAEMRSAAVERNSGIESLVIRDGTSELRLIDACVQAGAIDPVGGQRRAWVDGTDANTNAAMVDLLRSVVVLSQREKVNIDDYRSSWKT